MPVYHSLNASAYKDNNKISKHIKLWTKLSLFLNKVTATNTSWAVLSSESARYHLGAHYTPLPWQPHASNSRTCCMVAAGTIWIGLSQSAAEDLPHSFGCLSDRFSNKRLFMSNFVPAKVEPPSRPCGLSRVQQCECEWRCVECECE